MSSHKIINTTKTSDRRAAAGTKATRYLHANQELGIADDKKIDKSFQLLQEIKQNSKSDWDPSHFRLFVGNIGQDVDEELLLRSLIKYPSVSKVQIPKDHRKGENKGYGFVSFSDPDDYIRCFKEMNGKYIGSKPVELKKAKSKEPATKKNRKR